MVRDGAKAPPHHEGRAVPLPMARKIAALPRACTSPALPSTLPANEPSARPQTDDLRKWEEIIHETRLYPANHDLQRQSGRGTQRFAHVGRGPSAVRARQEVHPRDRRPDVGRIRAAWRGQEGPLELYTRAARGAAEGQGQG